MRKMIPLKQALKPFLSVLIGLSLGLMCTRFAGESPWNVFQIMVKSAFGSRYDLGMTLFYATPLIFTGLSVSFAMHSGLFNVGAEGQLALGALAAAACGILFPSVPFPLAPLLATAFAFAGGALLGAIPGWLKAKRGSHEVINTIMLNFISAGLCSWVTLYLLRNKSSQNPETVPVGPSFLIPHFHFFDEAPVSVALGLALGVTLVFWFILWKTGVGFEMRAIGQNECAAKAAGIPISRIRILCMAISGGIAGLVGVGEVLGNGGVYRFGFSPGYGFMGIAVALLGRNQPLGILASAFLFGALHKGTADLDMETENITRDFSLILQALVILTVSAEAIWKNPLPRLKLQRGKAASRVQPSVSS